MHSSLDPQHVCTSYRELGPLIATQKWKVMVPVLKQRHGGELFEGIISVFHPFFPPVLSSGRSSWRLPPLYFYHFPKCPSDGSQRPLCCRIQQEMLAFILLEFRRPWTQLTLSPLGHTLSLRVVITELDAGRVTLIVRRPTGHVRFCWSRRELWGQQVGRVSLPPVEQPFSVRHHGPPSRRPEPPPHVTVCFQVLGVSPALTPALRHFLLGCPSHFLSAVLRSSLARGHLSRAGLSGSRHPVGYSDAEFAQVPEPLSSLKGSLFCTSVYTPAGSLSGS